jgi:hypothetical protein
MKKLNAFSFQMKTTFLEMIKKIYQGFFISALERIQGAGPLPCGGGGVAF